MSKLDPRYQSNVIWQYINGFGGVGLAGVCLLVLSIFMTPQDFGKYVFCAALPMALAQFVDIRAHDIIGSWGYSDSSGKQEPIRSSKIFSLWVIDVSLKTLVGLGLIAFASFTDNLGEYSQLFDKKLLILSVILYLVSKAGAPVLSGVFRAHAQTKLLAVCATLDNGARLVAALSIALIFDVIPPQLFISVSICIGVSANLYLHARMAKLICNQDKTKNVPVRQARSILIEGIRIEKKEKPIIIHNWLISVTDLFNKDLDVVVAGLLLGPVEIGAYKLVKTAVLLGFKVIEPFYIALIPQIASLYGRETIEKVLSDSHVKETRKYSVVLACLVIATIMVVAQVAQMRFSYLGTIGQSLAEMVLCAGIWLFASAFFISSHGGALALQQPSWILYGQITGLTLASLFLYVTYPLLGIQAFCLGWTINNCCVFTIPAVLIKQRGRSVGVL